MGSVAGRLSRPKKVKTKPFPERNGKLPFNASGVAQVGARRFVFIDNKDATAFFEMTLDEDCVAVERIRRRRLAGVGHGMFGDPEGLTAVEVDGETMLIASSSFSVAGAHTYDGLVRVRYRPEGDLHAEAMPGFRAWLLAHEPTLAGPGRREPDAGGLNVEGLAWDPGANALLFGLRGPVTRGQIVVIRVPVDAGRARWTTASLGPPAMMRCRIPRSGAAQGVRDIAYDSRTGEFLLLLGRSASRGLEPFQLCTWNGWDDDVRLLDVAFHRAAKPEGITPFSIGHRQKILVVDDSGGYAVL